MGIFNGHTLMGAINGQFSLGILSTGTIQRAFSMGSFQWASFHGHVLTGIFQRAFSKGILMGIFQWVVFNRHFSMGIFNGHFSMGIFNGHFSTGIFHACIHNEYLLKHNILAEHLFLAGFCYSGPHASESVQPVLKYVSW